MSCSEMFHEYEYNVPLYEAIQKKRGTLQGKLNRSYNINLSPHCEGSNPLREKDNFEETYGSMQAEDIRRLEHNLVERLREEFR